MELCKQYTGDQWKQKDIYEQLYQKKPIHHHDAKMMYT